MEQPEGTLIHKKTTRSTLGTLSLILGFVTGLGTCLYLLLVPFMLIGGGEFGVTLALMGVTCVQSIIALLNLLGLLLGILALVKKEARKGLPIAGLVLNIISIALSILILWFSISSISALNT